jgi:hypothetical protein
MRKHKQELLIKAARELAKLHGIFFAAALLADNGISIEVALTSLLHREELRRIKSHT